MFITQAEEILPERFEIMSKKEASQVWEDHPLVGKGEVGFFHYTPACNLQGILEWGLHSHNGSEGYAMLNLSHDYKQKERSRLFYYLQTCRGARRRLNVQDCIPFFLIKKSPCVWSWCSKHSSRYHQDMCCLKLKSCVLNDTAIYSAVFNGNAANTARDADSRSGGTAGIPLEDWPYKMPQAMNLLPFSEFARPGEYGMKASRKNQRNSELLVWTAPESDKKEDASGPLKSPLIEEVHFRLKSSFEQHEEDCWAASIVPVFSESSCKDFFQYD